MPDPTREARFRGHVCTGACRSGTLPDGFAGIETHSHETAVGEVEEIAKRLEAWPCGAAPDATPGRPVFNRTGALRDSVAQIQKRGQKGGG